MASVSGQHRAIAIGQPRSRRRRALLATVVTTLALGGSVSVAGAAPPLPEPPLSEPRFLVQALRFTAIDESSYDWAGSDEVFAVVDNDDTKVATQIHGNVDSGDTVSFGFWERCITPVMVHHLSEGGDLRLLSAAHGDQWWCKPTGKAGPIQFEVGLYEDDSGWLPEDWYCFQGYGLPDPKTCADDEIGRFDRSFSTAQLTSLMPRVGDIHEESVELGGPCGPGGGICTEPFGPWYWFTYRITRLNDRPPLAAPPSTVAVDEESAACAEGKTLGAGQLTVATAERASEPYVVDDTPESGQGLEAALAYAVAGTMGFDPDHVTWTATTIDDAVQPGPKGFDFSLQQHPITAEHEQAVSFSQPYYSANQAILGYEDSPAAAAETITDFQALRIGVAAGTTSLSFVANVLQPASDPVVYNDSASAEQALDAQQIDAIVAELPAALSVAASNMGGATVFGQFAAVEGTEGQPWGLLFAADNPLVECVNLALATLRESGELEAITTTWMSEVVDVPQFTLEL